MEEESINQLTDQEEDMAKQVQPVVQVPQEILDEEYLEIKTRELDAILADKEVELAQTKAALATLKKDYAKLHHENYILKVYIKYGLSGNDSIKIKQIVRGGASK